jgi:hypothetical protein
VLAAQLRPCVRSLRAAAVPLGRPAHRTSALARTFGERLQSHYLSMRDDGFVAGAAAVLDEVL